MLGSPCTLLLVNAARRGDCLVGVEVRGVCRSARDNLGRTEGSGESFLAHISVSASCTPLVNTVTSSSVVVVVVVVVMTLSISSTLFLGGRPGPLRPGLWLRAGLLRAGLLPLDVRPRLLDRPRLRDLPLLDERLKLLALCQMKE